MLWYPLLAEFEHVRDIHYAAYQSLALSLLKAAHTESVRAREGWVNAEPPTPKKHQSCRELLNISEGKNEDSQSEPKWQVPGTVTNTGRRQKLQRRCNELTRSCACSRRSGDRSCCIGLGTVRLWRGHVRRAKLERDQTKSNKIKRNQDLTLASPRVCPCLKLMYLSVLWQGQTSSNEGFLGPMEKGFPFVWWHCGQSIMHWALLRHLRCCSDVLCRS